jgi:DNA-binding NarL/FixJ family response regulator
VSLRVMVVDDQPLVRTGLGRIIGTAPDLCLVGEATTGREAIAQVRELRPDVVLMDIRMPDLNGIDATEVITSSGDARVLMLTTFDVDEYVYAALRAGASGFLLKDTAPSDLLTAIRVIAAGDALLAPSVTRRLITRFAAEPLAPGGGGAVEPRNRRPAAHQPRDGEDPRDTPADETGRAGSRTAGDPGLPGGARLQRLGVSDGPSPEVYALRAMNPRWEIPSLASCWRYWISYSAAGTGCSD